MTFRRFYIVEYLSYSFYTIGRSGKPHGHIPSTVYYAARLEGLPKSIGSMSIYRCQETILEPRLSLYEGLRLRKGCHGTTDSEMRYLSLYTSHDCNGIHETRMMRKRWHNGCLIVVVFVQQTLRMLRICDGDRRGTPHSRRG